MERSGDRRKDFEAALPTSWPADVPPKSVDDAEKAGLLLEPADAPDAPPGVKGRKHHGSGNPLVSFVAALAYGLTSLAMVFLNKAVLQRFSYSMTLLTLQQATTAALISVGGRHGLMAVRGVGWTTARKLLPLSLFYNSNVAFALASLNGVNIPMYIALKRMTPLGVLVAGYFCGRKGRPSAAVSLSVLITALGVVIAAAGDFSFDPTGYLMAVSSVCCQTAYLILVEKSGEEGLSSTEMMLYNAILSLPFLALYVVATGELAQAAPLLWTKMAADLGFGLLVVLSLVMGIALNFTMFLCTATNSALTTTIVGVLKGVGSTVFGFVLLGGVPVHGLNVAGLVINTIGGVLYCIVKYREKKARKQYPKPQAL